jgi:hypothetical protein
MFVVKNRNDGYFHVLNGGRSVQHFRCRDNARCLAYELNKTLKDFLKQIPGAPKRKKANAKKKS